MSPHDSKQKLADNYRQQAIMISLNPCYGDKTKGIDYISYP